VFSIDATLSLMQSEQLGVGLAVALLINATLVRGVLLPATALLGDRSRWLHRLPAGSS
jgi:RND superfamily putative drug exporter